MIMPPDLNNPADVAYLKVQHLLPWVPWGSAQVRADLPSYLAYFRNPVQYALVTDDDESLKPADHAAVAQAIDELAAVVPELKAVLDQHYPGWQG